MTTRTHAANGIRASLAAALCLLLAVATSLAAQQHGPANRPVRSSCDMCHGELEFLRQNTPTMVRARAALVPDSIVAGSAHGELACTECHQRFGKFPHSPQGETLECASCHQPQDSAWQRGGHALREQSEGATCAQCHGVHQVLPLKAFKDKPGITAMNGTCIGCHQEQRLPATTPHADSTLCSGCHGAHDVRRMDEAASTLHVLNQIETCGTCHDSIAAVWRRSDVHYKTLTGEQQRDEGVRHKPPACTDCHGAHGLNASPDSLLEAAAVRRCAECHEDYARTFQNSYHGRATNLGSKASATCADCHGAHDILPRNNALSRVSEIRLIETCKACHEHAREAFVKYDSHPDPLNFERNPWISASFWFMNSLLVFVLVVFGTHTLLWWLRLYLDKKRGVGHGHGHGEGGSK